MIEDNRFTGKQFTELYYSQNRIKRLYSNMEIVLPFISEDALLLGWISEGNNGVYPLELSIGQNIHILGSNHEPALALMTEMAIAERKRNHTTPILVLTEDEFPMITDDPYTTFVHPENTDPQEILDLCTKMQRGVVLIPDIRLVPDRLLTSIEHAVFRAKSSFILYDPILEVDRNRPYLVHASYHIKDSGKILFTGMSPRLASRVEDYTKGYINLDNLQTYGLARAMIHDGPMENPGNSLYTLVSTEGSQGEYYAEVRLTSSLQF